MVIFNRRRFVGQAVMASAAVGLAVNGVRPPATEAQAAAILGLFGVGGPILSVVNLFESGYKFISHMNDPKLIDIATQLERVAATLENRFDDLKLQTRQIVREELQWENLRQSTVELAGLSHRFSNATMRGGGGPSDAQSISRELQMTITRLGGHGVAGSLAYVNAVALMNSIHSFLGSTPEVVENDNTSYLKTLDDTVYNGRSEKSLERAIQVTRNEKNSAPYYSNFRFLVYRIGSWYSVGVVTRYYESALSTADLLYRYEGFSKGEPVIAYRSYGQEVFSENSNRNYAGRLVKATFKPTGTSIALEIAVKPNGGFVFPQTWPSGQALVNQVNSIAAEYKRLYDFSYGPEISARMSFSFDKTPEQAELRQYLIDTGLGSIERILVVARKNLASSSAISTS